MRVLVTNDDGVMSDGLAALAKEMAALARVTVVAPDRERSATGHAITMFRPLRVEPVKLKDLDVEAYAVDGTPSDCVKLAVEALMTDRPDLVIAGVNRGPNLGTDVLYSGTVSAAVEGLMLGIPSLAVSVAAFENCNYGLAARFAAMLARRVHQGPFPADTLLNVNVPSVDDSEVTGVAITRLGARKYRDVFDKRTDPRGKTYYWLAGDPVESDDAEDVDAVAVRCNKISVTPVRFDFTHYEMMEKLSRWNLEVPPQACGGSGAGRFTTPDSPS